MATDASLLAPVAHTLSNGLRLLVTPMPYARSVSISVYIAAGSRYEPTEEEAGLSHFLEHLCFKGTSRRPRPLDISMELDAIGGNINAATNRELTVYYAKVTPEHLEQATDVVADMLRNSLLADSEIERERGVILEELAAVEDSPTEQVGVLLDRQLWPGQPHGRDVAGTDDSVAEMPNRRIVDYYHRQYVPNATVVSLAGAISPEAALDLVQRRFGDWAPGVPVDWVRHHDLPRGPRIDLLEKDTEQAHVAVGMRALHSSDDDRYALDLLSIILGEGMSSRLFSRLREELGLCYDIHSYMSTLLDTGMFGIYAGVDPARAKETVREISRELASALHPISADELARAKAVSRSRTQLRLEDTRSVSATFGSLAVLGLPLRTPEEALARSQAVAIDDVRRVAERVILEDALQLAIVGPVNGDPLEAVLTLGA
ncbi:MAG: pitrilysin family protein [Dehalococcoidia bacterium]